VLVVGALGASTPGLAASAGRPPPGIDRALPGLRFGPSVDRLPAGPTSELHGVFCTSPANCWAVGDTSGKGGRLNQVLHWTGKHWFAVAVPNPAGTAKGDGNELLAVRCTTASNCWAVGDAQRVSQGGLDQALHWNGKKWFAVTTPTPAGVLSGDFNDLNDVTCTSARSCWAVGDYGVDTSTTTSESVVALNQVLHWNGTAWSLVSSPDPGGTVPNQVNGLSGVRCTSAADCWAAGTFGKSGAIGMLALHNEMLHWNGKKWATVTVPNPAGTGKGHLNELSGLACASASECWAVGVSGTVHSMITALNDILHWNGKKWFKQTAPNPGGSGPGSDNELLAVTCSGPRNCWAVGSTGGILSSMAMRNEALRWNGTKWSSFRTPSPGGTDMNDRNVLNGARCTSAANCWAVGVSEKHGGTDKNEILHWKGKKWFVG
jgi:hypothetical protein